MQVCVCEYIPWHIPTIVPGPRHLPAKARIIVKINVADVQTRRGRFAEASGDGGGGHEGAREADQAAYEEAQG